PGARAPRTLRTARARRPLFPLRQEPPDHRLGLGVVALADVPVADNSLAIDQERRRPGPGTPALPDREIVVLHDRILDSELLRGVHHLAVRLFPEKLRRVHSDDREPFLLVTLVPAPQLRDNVLAVDSAVRPELHHHDPAAQARRGQGLAVDPPLPRHVRRRRAETHGLAGGRSGHEPRSGQGRHDERRAPSHGYCFFLSIAVSPCIILSSFIMAFPSFFVSSDFMSPFFIVSPAFILSSFFIVSSFFMLSWATDSPTAPQNPSATPTTATTPARPRHQ